MTFLQLLFFRPGYVSPYQWVVGFGPEAKASLHHTELLHFVDNEGVLNPYITFRLLPRIPYNR